MQDKMAVRVVIVFCLLIIPFAHCLDSSTNVALNKTTWQSSLGHHYGKSYKAVDGNMDSHYYRSRSCTRTGYVRSPYWAVDLGKQYKITKTVIVSRSDCCASRMHDYTIAVGNNRPTRAGALTSVCGSITGRAKPGEVKTFICPKPQMARYVQVYIRGTGYNILTICELQVFTSTTAGEYNFGNSPTNRKELDRWSNAIYITEDNRKFTKSGQVLEWKYYARRTGEEIDLQVWRKSKTSSSMFTLIGQTRAKAKSIGINTVPASTAKPINVKPGDVLGFFFPGRSVIPFDYSSCYSNTLYVKSPSRTSVQVGRTFRFQRKPRSWKACRKYSLSAKIGTANPKPDCGPDTKMGPHSTSCLMKWWLEAGCKIKGKGSPENSVAARNWWNMRTVGHVKTDMRMYKQYAQESNNKFYRDLCYGVVQRVDCNKTSSTPGPHHISCLNQWWKESGCLEVGQGSPAKSQPNVVYWNKMKISEVKQDMKEYRQRAEKNKIRKRDKLPYKLLCFGRNQTLTCGISGTIVSQKTGRVFKGQDVKSRERWPWMMKEKMTVEQFIGNIQQPRVQKWTGITTAFEGVSLQIASRKFHYCGGVLIHPNWVLTAAHCVKTYQNNPAGKVAVMGSLDLNKKEDSRQIRKMKKIYVHPKYVLRRFPFFIVNDVALIELDSPVPLGKYIRTVCLPDKAGAAYTNCHIVGWGRRKTSGRTGGIMQEADTTAIPDSVCVSKWPQFVKMIKEGATLCCTPKDRSRICKGDSGGPLLCQQGANNWVTIGQASWAPTSCSATTKPFAYSDVREFVPWIRQTCIC